MGIRTDRGELYMEILEKLLEWGGIKKDIAFLVISGIALILSISGVTKPYFEPAWIAVIFCGIPIILEALIGLITAFDIKADVLVSIALIASLIIGEYFAAGEVAFIMQLGGLLEELTVARARQGIENLVRLTPRTARRIKESSAEEVIAAEDVKRGDILRVLPGESIPVDGIIIKGETSVDQAVMTGESLPVDKKPGDEVSGGTVNQFGAFDMRAERVGEDSSIQRMIRLVQSADAGKAKIVSLADRWATWIVVTALTAAVVTFIITGEIIRSVTILVVFCPCALVLATPTAIMAAIGNVTKHGFLVKEGDALERLASVTDMAFDKTGTLTHGVPRVIKAEPVEGKSEKELFSLAASAESMSEHPLGEAVVRCYRERYKDGFREADDFKMIISRGVEATVGGERVTAGNEQLFSERGLDIPSCLEAKALDYVNEGCSVIFVSSGKEMEGFLALSDTLKEDAGKSIEGIVMTGVRPILLTGDNKNAAVHIAKSLGISELRWECMPEDKLNIIDELQEKGRKVCMAGDGINDAPALKKAYVGIAMGGVGSDIAVDAADIALINDDIKEIPHLIRLSKRMMLTIKCNLSFSMTLNFIAIILAMTGILTPVVGALVHNAGSVLVIINSALLLKWRSVEDN